MAQPVSLQRQLVKSSLLSSILAGLLALLMFIGVSVYQTMSMQDEIMDEMADMLLADDLTVSNGQALAELSDEFDIRYRLDNAQQLLTASEDVPEKITVDHLSLVSDAPYGFYWSEQKLWRIYSAQDEHGLQVQVTQLMSDRFQAFGHTILIFSGVLLLVWCVQWLLMHFAIRRKFRTIHQVSEQISNKSVNDLAPISMPEPKLIELQPMLSQLNALLARLDQALVAEQRFTADASHELRSPLSAIQMRLQVLKRKFPELESELKPIQQDVSRGVQVLDNLLLLARLDPEQKESLAKTKFDFSLLMRDVMKALQPFSDSKQIKINVVLAEQVYILANEQLLFSALRNLLDNAIRYSPEQAQVFVNLTIEKQQLRLRIENSGYGVDAAVIQRLGERFYRALGTKTQGSGLGLSICQKIVDLHAGQLLFSSSDLGGLKVELLLNRVEP
ncbi:HAMP domain-containing histidine kinase [Acinetobacter johnsonii]|uniref:sensor histidine kinase n=1 Tax=Acinetobacter johnsonii TaxID=40214 RepID=UPI000F6732AA|nr:HAMP domain-containing sensor histidine kinase [Acinetobacter johnsonii]QYA56051.1 HAMP domain-containing histidine kinase [Acinetobacter johnsonii]